MTSAGVPRGLDRRAQPSRKHFAHPTLGEALNNLFMALDTA
jgi:hypothetical protein